MSFETDLDKYLTTPPDDNSSYYEAVYDLITDELLSPAKFDKYETTLDRIISECHIKDISIKDCAKFLTIIIELDLLESIKVKPEKWKKRFAN